jgi:hypothetical protein
MLVKRLAIAKEIAENNWQARARLIPEVYSMGGANPGKLDRNGDHDGSEQHKNRAISEDMRKLRGEEHQPMELREKWQKSKATLEAIVQLGEGGRERGKATPVMMELMWGWCLASEMTELKDENGDDVFTTDELELMSRHGLTGEMIDEAMNEKSRPLLDKWGIQGFDRQNEIFHFWTGKDLEERTNESDADYQEGITDSEIYLQSS